MVMPKDFKVGEPVVIGFAKSSELFSDSSESPGVVIGVSGKGVVALDHITGSRVSISHEDNGKVKSAGDGSASAVWARRP